MRLAFSETDIQSEFWFQDGFDFDSSEFLQKEKLVYPYFRLATKADEKALKNFYISTFSKNENAAVTYSTLGCKNTRTYVIDLSENTSFIASALTVATDCAGLQHIIFCGTLPPLRRRGLFTTLLHLAKKREEEINGEFNAIFTPKTPKQYFIMKKRGFIHNAYALECSLSGIHSNYKKFSRSWQADYDYSLCREYHYGEGGFSPETNKALFNYYRAAGNDYGMICDGYIAFSPLAKEDTYSGEKGKFIIDECAISPKELKNLASAFEKCLYPLWREDELKKAKIKYEKVISAITTFDPQNKYFRF